MPREIVSLLPTAMTVWIVAIALKALDAVRAGREYKFGLWDGGLIRAGKSLTPTGTRIKLISSSLIAVAMAALALHLLPIKPTAYVIIAMLTASIVADSATLTP